MTEDPKGSMNGGGNGADNLTQFPSQKPVLGPEFPPAHLAVARSVIQELIMRANLPAELQRRALLQPQQQVNFPQIIIEGHCAIMRGLALLLDEKLVEAGEPREIKLKLEDTGKGN